MPYIPYQFHPRGGGFNPRIRRDYIPAWWRRRSAEARMQRVANSRRGAYQTRRSDHYHPHQLSRAQAMLEMIRRRRMAYQIAEAFDIPINPRVFEDSD